MGDIRYLLMYCPGLQKERDPLYEEIFSKVSWLNDKFAEETKSCMSWLLGRQLNGLGMGLTMDGIGMDIQDLE